MADRPTGNVLAPAYYVIVAAIVSLATVMTMRETAARPLRNGPRQRNGVRTRRSPH